MTQAKKQNNLDMDIARINAFQAIMVAIIAIVPSLISGYFTGINSLGGQDRINEERKITNRLVVNQIESELNESKGKILSSASSDSNILFEKRLKKAVFLNILTFQANSDILKNSLEILSKRGYHISDVQINKIVAELPEIKVTKLRWLEDQAIPALQKNIEFLQQNPQIQRNAYADVSLPQSISILNQQNIKSTFKVTNIAILKEEVDIIKNSIK